MQTLWGECMVCGDTITSEICYRCVEDKVVEWLQERDATQLGAVRRVGASFHTSNHSGADCMLCGGNLNVCSKCYSLSVHKALRRNRILASEFLEFAASKGFMLSSKKGVLNLQR